MEKFDCTYKYKLIYVFSMPYDTHKGLLKIGEATLTTDTKPEYLTPNCRELNQAAIARIKGYTATASVNFKLEYTELAVLQKDGYTFTFKDKDVHKVLMNSRVHKVQPNGATGEEWFETTLDVAVNAIKAVKAGKSTLSATEKTSSEKTTAKIDFREEQEAAIEQTIKAFKKDNEMLLRTIVAKVINRNDFETFANLVYPRDLYRLTETLYEENNWAITRPSEGHKYDL
ncbi:MAG: hypothetical protein PUD59_06275 [bacterium]|nr:hypothetical protein [bacterium]